jgi:pilus retraction protein PilT
MNYDSELNDLVLTLVKEGGSDIHFTVGTFPTLRINGELIPLTRKQELTAQDTVGFLRAMVGEKLFTDFVVKQELDFSYEHGKEYRLRGNASFQRGVVSIALRLVPKARSIQELNLPEQLVEFSRRKQGFFLVVGPVGQGKSTTIAAMISLINQESKRHIVTIEDPIEFRFEQDKSLIEQREVGIDTKDFATALRHAFRQDMDVIMIGEMRDKETISAAVTAAETGHLVLSTLHTNSAAQTVDRIIDSFPGDQQGQQIDADLSAMDVRLTMGGEPTFVAAEDRDGEEWNTAAMGPNKRRYAIQLLQKLRDRYGANGFLHFGQGKWYPGEQLPRWALSAYWRADGEPCWLDPYLFADEQQPQHYTERDALRFIRLLSAKLGVSDEFLVPGYEDAWYYLWRERRLPVNVDPHDARLDDELERARLRKVFDQGLDKVVGYALPLQRDPLGGINGNAWVSGRWFLRDERMYLIPGDSPMGYRLPLDSLPWVSKGDYPWQFDQDPFAERSALPTAAALRAQYPHAKPAAAALTLHAAGQTPPARFESARHIVRSSLCVETRNGHLYVFLPPLTQLDDYLDLLAALESTAAELKLQIILEGYPPPRDPRLKVLQVTPDPGVIEVNIHPASNWDELVDHTEFLYQAAHETRLSSEKFMLDGRHSGTGGGNHIVLGGATAADSPFLRRPDLLASLIAYWHNHPSLSYLFSGLFIGPTSQAPRVDEARNDSLYELEIAFGELRKQLDQHGENVPPWLIDRLLRNLLIDVTGNTHRAEFCIDKLYSPDGPTGRLGLLELRAFEMPPHARMSLTQQLLLRALVARFWKTPYRARLTRWGTELHDRFMLPSFVRMDFEDVLSELADAGYAFDPGWFDAHFEFRFPHLGELSVKGMHLDLRHALEPWHVMGEEGGAGGTVRYVDSSVERLELRVNGLNANRYSITANGQPLPLQPTGRVGEYVAGVRYRAWQPSSALHPTIAVDAPLTFDIVDTWMQRSLGGCQYHVAHPGGRNYATFPINAYEAESRRLARFFRMGHTPGKVAAALAPASLDYPFTLDLRRQAG